MAAIQKCLDDGCSNALRGAGYDGRLACHTLPPVVFSQNLTMILLTWDGTRCSIDFHSLASQLCDRLAYGRSKQLQPRSSYPPACIGHAAFAADPRARVSRSARQLWNRV